MLMTLLVIVPFGLALAALSMAAMSLPASRRSRVNAAAGGPSVPPARPSPAGGMAVPIASGQPDLDERTAFAYDNGVQAGPPAGEDTT